jgi:hypothetical protein
MWKGFLWGFCQLTRTSMVGIPLSSSWLHTTVLAPGYRTWAVVTVRCKIANCSLKAVYKGLNISWYRHHLYNLWTCFMIELFFRFTVKGAVLLNNVFFQHVVTVRCTVQRFIAKPAKSEKPVLYWKIVAFWTGDFKMLKTVGNPYLDQNEHPKS